MNPANNTPPNLVEIGTVPPEVVSAVQGMNERYTRILIEVGQLEARKSELLAEGSRLQSTSNRILKGESDRLGIPAGHPWSLSPDGKALVPPALAEAIQGAVAKKAAEELESNNGKASTKKQKRGPTPEG